MELVLSLFGWFWKPWFATGLIALLSAVCLAFVFRRHRGARGRLSAARTKPRKSSAQLEQQVRSAILQVVPIHPHNGWQLEGMWHGLRVFSRSFPSLSPSNPSSALHESTTPVMAASLIVNYPTKRALSLAVNTKELGSWLKGVSPHGIQVLLKDGNGDILQMANHKRGRGIIYLTRKRIVRFFEKYVSFLDGFVAPPTEVTTETIERTWLKSEAFSYVFMLPKLPSLLPYSWSLLMFNPLKEPGICLATLVMMPCQQNEEVCSLVAKQLCSLREHATLKSLGVYSTSHETTHTLLPQSKPKINNVRETGGAPGDKPHPRKPRSQRILSEPSVLEPIKEVRQPEPHPQHPVSTLSEPNLVELSQNHTAASPTAALDARYFSVAEASAQKLVAAADGREREGWVMVGTTKEVTVMKKPAGKDEPPINSVKGVGLVKVPPRFIIRVLNDPSYTTILDDMLKESRVLQELSKSLHLVQLLYKAVWPTAPREFSVLSILGQLDERTWISSGISVNDPRIQPEKGYVRAQLDVGGYLIRSVPSNPEVSEVTYVARVDLKGNIPAFAVNKISESQPLCVNRLRGLVEPLYAKMKSDPQKMREFEEKYPIAMVITPKPNSTPLAASLSNTAMEEAESVAAAEDDIRRGVESAESVNKETMATSGGERQAVPSANSSSGDGGAALSEPRSPVGDGNGEKTDVSNGGREGLAAATTTSEGGGEGDGGRENGLPTSNKNGKEEDKKREDTMEGSTLVISMSDINPTKSLKIPQNSKLLASNEESLFSIGEEDGESMANSWTGEFLETYTPEQLPSDPEEEEREKEDKSQEDGSPSGSVFVKKPSPALQLKLPNYQRVRDSIAPSDEAVETHSLTKDTINYPMLVQGGVDFKTMANQTAARALEEAFHVSSLNPQDPSTFTDQGNGWRFSGYEKEVVILSKKTEDSPYTSFMGKGVIGLPPQTVFESVRNPQLRFTYDNMLKELHIVKQVDESLYILHLHHQTTQCFVKTSRDFCILVSERCEPNKMLLVGTSIDVPECPPIPNVHRGRIFCSGWIVEPFQGSTSATQITYMLQVDVGGLPSSLVNFVSKRQPLAVAYLRDYLVSTSLELSAKSTSSSSGSG